MDRYYFYDDYRLPAEFEKTVPQVFPTTAPGNFTWLADMEKMIYNMLYLTNRGIAAICRRYTGLCAL